ncbi:MAG: glycoside hydrolase family 3 protein [Chloroflexota bacterium]
MSTSRSFPNPTRRQFLYQIGQMVGATLLSGCAAVKIDHVPQDSTPASAIVKEALKEAVKEVNAPPLPGPITPQLGSQSITLEQQIGQMIMTGFDGAYLNEKSPIIQDIHNQRIGGVALFGRNVESVPQLQTLTSMLQQAAPNPLLISVDQEGGRVRRIGSTFGISYNYSAAQLGALDDLQATADYANEMAKVLSNLGINLNLAPVVDVNVNPHNPVIGSQQRSFSSDPETVANHALTFIQAHHREGILCTIKHFPGHGSSAADSHVGFVDVTTTWTADELTPFERIIDAKSCDAVMTAHIFNANLDEENPATLSKTIITGLLRQRMGYDGVIMTDDIQMGAIRRFYDYETAISLAVQAGVDIFTFSRYSPAIVTRIISTIRKLVSNRQLTEERIYQSYKRIIQLKSQLNVRRSPATPAQTTEPTRDQNPPPAQDIDYLRGLEQFLF